MTYTVLWHPKAEAELAAVWLDAPNRTAVTTAAAAVDGWLAADPLAAGESRDPASMRLGFERPLGVYFEIIEDDKKVVVRHVFAVG